MHRDLKIENILLTSLHEPHIKLADFGFATRISPDQLLTTRIGSIEYMAPEIILSQPYDGSKSDIWALGVILFAMLFGELPFNFEPGQSPKNLYHKICRCEFQFPDSPADEYENNIYLSEHARDLISGMLTSASKRLTIDEIFEHPFTIL